MCWRSWTTNECDGVSGKAGRPCSGRIDSKRVKYSSASVAPERLSMISSASRLRFSIRPSLSMLGHAHSSPSVSGATVW